LQSRRGAGIDQPGLVFRSGSEKIGGVSLNEGNNRAPRTLTAAGNEGDLPMLYWTLVFLVIALIAGVLGFGGIAGASAGIAQILFFIFLAFLVISLVAGFIRRT